VHCRYHADSEYKLYAEVDNKDAEFIGKTFFVLEINVILFDLIHSRTYSALYISLVQIDLIVFPSVL